VRTLLRSCLTRWPQRKPWPRKAVSFAAAVAAKRDARRYRQNTEDSAKGKNMVKRLFLKLSAKDGLHLHDRILRQCQQ
jgi:hypothetical protein